LTIGIITFIINPMQTLHVKNANIQYFMQKLHAVGAKITLE